SSCMFRFIIQLDPFYSLAWVGWASSEHEINSVDEVAKIYDMALQALPLDYLIRIYSAEFYIGINNKQKAKEILKQTFDEMVQNREEETIAYQEVTKLLNSL